MVPVSNGHLSVKHLRDIYLSKMNLSSCSLEILFCHEFSLSNSEFGSILTGLARVMSHFWDQLLGHMY